MTLSNFEEECILTLSNSDTFQSLTQTVVHERVAHRANLILNKPLIDMKSIICTIDIIGKSAISIKYVGMVNKTFALVARGMDFTCLISLHDLQRLLIISDNFPSCILDATSHDLTFTVAEDFSAVFKDELESLRCQYIPY